MEVEQRSAEPAANDTTDEVNILELSNTTSSSTTAGETLKDMFI